MWRDKGALNKALWLVGDLRSDLFLRPNLSMLRGPVMNNFDLLIRRTGAGGLTISNTWYCQFNKLSHDVE